MSSYGVHFDPMKKTYTVSVSGQDRYGTIVGLDPQTLLNLAVMMARSARVHQVQWPQFAPDDDLVPQLQTALGENQVPVSGPVLDALDARLAISHIQHGLREAIFELDGLTRLLQE